MSFTHTTECVVYELANLLVSPIRLTQAVLQIQQQLGLYEAELARVLHLYCSDIGRFSHAQQCLQPTTIAWDQAVLFVRLYQGLYKKYAGDSVAMVHWLRAQNKELEGIPLLLIIDESQLSHVANYLEIQAS